MRELEARRGEILAPFQVHVDNPMTIPGVNDTTGGVPAGEVGLDMTHFPTVGHLISWARAVPQTRRECRQARGLLCGPSDQAARRTRLCSGGASHDRHCFNLGQPGSP